MAVDSLSSTTCDSATPEIVVNRWPRHISGVVSTIVATAFRARARHLWAMREQALARGDVADAERWHERLVEHEATDWLAEVAR